MDPKIAVICYMAIVSSALLFLWVYHYLAWRSSLSDARYWHGEAQKYWTNWRNALLKNKSLQERIDSIKIDRRNDDTDDADWWKKR